MTGTGIPEPILRPEFWDLELLMQVDDDLLDHGFERKPAVLPDAAKFALDLPDVAPRRPHDLDIREGFFHGRPTPGEGVSEYPI